MRKIVTEDFDAQIGIWGSVERAPGTEGEIYDLEIQCVDFSAAEPKVIYQVKAQTKSVSEIPHVYVKKMLDALYGRKPGSAPSLDLAAEDLWSKNPNLVVGGDFESGKHGVPKGWEPVAGQQREPLGNLVRWIPEKENPQNKLIHFEFPQIVGDNEGVMYFSDFFPVEEGAKYRFQCRYRTDGPKVKVFIKCYGEERTAYQSEPKGSGFKVQGSEAGGQGSEVRGQGLRENTPHSVLPTPYSTLREVYRDQMNLKGEKNQWHTHTEEFTPRHTKYSPKWGRVMLYAYLGAGSVEFDDVVVKQIVPPPLSQKPKERKHSSATKVTIEEIQENERRSREK
jgi:hypothetical protein